MKQDTIIEAIEAKIGDTDHLIWRIGITNDPDRSQLYWSETEKKKIFFWTHWQAESLQDAQTIKSHFMHKYGMKNGSENGPEEVDGEFIYLF
jgi:sugar lactone lactonase YvrE